VDLDTPASEIRALSDSGLTVICYFSVGSAEPFRADYKAKQSAWQAAVVGKMAGWDEYWLDTSKLLQLKTLMQPRFETAKAKGCHGVDPDNVDCYQNSQCGPLLAGGSLSKSQQLEAQVAYNEWQIETAHALDMIIGLKNSADLIPRLGQRYDFSINESCAKYKECALYKPMLALDKAVLSIEYSTDMAGLCAPCAEICNSNRTDASRALVPDQLMFAKFCPGNRNVCTSGEWRQCYVDLGRLDYKLLGNAEPPASAVCPCPPAIKDGALGFPGSNAGGSSAGVGLGALALVAILIGAAVMTALHRKLQQRRSAPVATNSAR
jgi:endo-alpha-1,4-polygalactosaminidase (GH114 family)